MVDKAEAAIRQRLTSPLRPAVYPSVGEREHAYRRIIVGNYLIFYVVIEDMIVVRRVLYGRRDIDRFL